jgi:hypothetical protein
VLLSEDKVKSPTVNCGSTLGSLSRDLKTRGPQC